MRFTHFWEQYLDADADTDAEDSSDFANDTDKSIDAKQTTVDDAPLHGVSMQS